MLGAGNSIHFEHRHVFAGEKVELVVSVRNEELGVGCIPHSGPEKQNGNVNPGLDEILNQVVCVSFAQSLKFFSSCETKDRNGRRRPDYALGPPGFNAVET